MRYAGLPSSSRTTLVVILGASEFPRSRLKGFVELKSAAYRVADYFWDPKGFGLPDENMMFLFDVMIDPDTLDRNISQFISKQIAKLHEAGDAARDLIIFYAGHGSLDEQRNYFLAIKTTRDENKAISSLTLSSLAQTVKRNATDVRVHFIIDACFASQSVKNFQFDPREHIKQEIRKIPAGGIGFLCSSASDVVSEVVPKFNNTLFSHALTECLWEGTGQAERKFSLRELRDLVDRRILHYSRDDPTIRYIEPQIHNPIQSGGEVSNVQLFPDGLRLALHRAEDREALRKRKEETSDRLTQGARLWNEKGITDQTASEEVALRSAVHDIQEWVQHKRAAEVESKIAEEKSIGEARQEAEEPWDRELSLDKVVSWLKWKSGEISLDILELDELLGDTRTQMGEAAQRAANLWEWKTKAEKTGSSGEVRELENRWGDERTIVRELKRKSDNIEDQKSDKLLSKRILDEMAVDGETSVRVIAKKARAASGTEVSSFATMLQRYIDKRVGWQQRKRHVKRSIKKTIKITLITMGVLLLVGSCIAGILQKH